LVEAVYQSYWKFFHEHVSSITIREMSEEEFNSTTTNFNIPYIGKLYADYNKIIKYKQRLKQYENAKGKENKANRLSSVSD
jgi:hypothetical protein